MIRSLLWKEWREQRWKILGIFGVYLTLVITAYLVEKRGAFEVAQGCILILSILVPGFVAMGTIMMNRGHSLDLRVLLSDDGYSYGIYVSRVLAVALDFLTFFAPQALVVYGITTLFPTFTRRRIISMVFGIGAALAFQMLFESTDSMQRAKALIFMSPVAAAGYAAIALALTAVLGWLVVLSVKHDWRTWFERALLPQPPLTPPRPAT